MDHCLKPAHRANWSEVGLAMAEFRMAKVLAASGRADEASPYSQAADAARDKYLREAPQHFRGIEKDAQAVHDQMLAFWHGRMTGKMKRSTP